MGSFQAACGVTRGKMMVDANYRWFPCGGLSSQFHFGAVSVVTYDMLTFGHMKENTAGWMRMVLAKSNKS